MGKGEIIHCRECRQPIITGQGFVFFKVPKKESYEFFHYRVRARDWWEAHLIANTTLATRSPSKTAG